MNLYGWRMRRRISFTTSVGMTLLSLLFSTFIYASWMFLPDGNTHPPTALVISSAIHPTVPSVIPISSPCPLPLSFPHDSIPSAIPVPSTRPLPPPSPYDSTKLAFITETRRLKHLPTVLGHMISIIPPEWKFLFLGSNVSNSYLSTFPALKQHISSGKLSLKLLPSNYTLTSREATSQIFTDPYFYSHVISPAEHLLVFQPDAIFCAGSKKSLNDYLEWDWIGAPWSKNAEWGGNGGLSLRKVSKIMQVLKKERRRIGDGQLEDLWLSSRINKLKGSRMPNATISKGFSVESVWDDAPLGYHVGWSGVHHEQIWDDPKQVDHIMAYCPEVKMILDMKLSGDKPKGVGL